MKAAPASRRVTKIQVHYFPYLPQVLSPPIPHAHGQPDSCLHFARHMATLRWKEDLHSFGHSIQALLAHAQYPGCLDKNPSPSENFKSLRLIRPSCAGLAIQFHKQTPLILHLDICASPDNHRFRLLASCADDQGEAGHLGVDQVGPKCK